MDDSELHLEREDSFKDLFDLLQPKSRLEDLVRIYGLREGVVSIDDPAKISRDNTPSSSMTNLNLAPSPTSGVFRSSGTSSVSSSKGTQVKGKDPSSLSRPPQPRITPVAFSALSVSFSSRKVGLILNIAGKTKRTAVEVGRTREERLEFAAKRLVRALRVWLEGQQ